MWGKQNKPEVQSVTSAASGRSDDLAKRQLQYAIAMTIRLVCFVLAVLVPYGWITWVFAVGAVILPYVAVLLANATGPGQRGNGPEAPTHERPALTSSVTYRLPPKH